MFGLGFTEILLIAIVALLFIGPDKLPDTMKQIARTFGKLKRAFDDTKETIQNELRVDDLRQEALGYRQQIEKAKEDLSAFKNVAQKEAQELKSAAAIEDKKFKPKDINDDADLWDELEEAEKEFEKLEKQEKSKIQVAEAKPQKANDPYANSRHEEQLEQLKKELNEEETQVVEFKHLKSKES